MTRPRRRVRSTAEQMYWDRLTPSERLAFTIGYAVGQGADFPTPQQIDALRGQLGLATAPQRPKAQPVRTVREPGADGYAHRGRPKARDADGQPFRYDYAEVASIACEAIADGRSPGRAVFEQIEQCHSVAAGQVAVSKARSSGHDIPRGGPGGRPTSRTEQGAA